MALSRLLQPNSTLLVSRLGLSASRAKVFSSGCSDGDGGIPPQLKEETAVEDTKVMLPDHIVSEAVVKEHAPAATLLGNIMAECGAPLKPRTLSDMFNVHKGDRNETMAGNEEIKHEESLSHCLMMSERDERPSRSKSCQNGLDLKDSATSSANAQATVQTDRPRNVAEKDPIKDFIQSLSVGAQNSPSNPTKLCRRPRVIKDNSSNAKAQRSDKHDRSNLLTFPAGTSTIEDRETSKSGPDPVELKEQINQCSKILLPTNNKELRQRQTKSSGREESEGYKVLVRFLQSSVSESTLIDFFKNCGEILKIECPDAPRSLLKTACIDFKTKNGLQKALGRSGMYLGGAIIVESATSENRSAAIPVPSLLGDPDIPAALVKYPTRTIRIEPLTENISSHHIVEALAFCNSKVCGYFLGSSPSVAYVELETESGKERALAKPSINVLGRQLVMLRVDSPRTTAVRITSRYPLEITVRDVVPVCRSLGDVGASFTRDANVLDVHFKASEWPNMLKILNSLNGRIVKGVPLHAEPAPIFPPEVLLALWRDPKEREHLKATVQALLLKLESKLDTSELAFLENDIYAT